MKLTCELLPAIEPATESDIERIIGGGRFGGYAALHGDDEGFLQVGFRGRPPAWLFDYEPGTSERDFAEGWKAFFERTGSETWVLDYVEGSAGENHEANGYRTLNEVTQAFLEYLRGDPAWRTRYSWTPASMNRGRLPEIPR